MRPLLAAAGVDFDQWKALTVVALKLDFRTSSLGQTQFRREASRILGFIGQFVFYTVVGGRWLFWSGSARDLFVVSTVTMTYVMFMVGTAVLIDHNSALASPVDYGILGFRPVSSRTYFAVRLTNVLVYTTLLTTVAAWLPIVSFFIRHDVVVGVAASPVSIELRQHGACDSPGVRLDAARRRARGRQRGLSYLQLAMAFSCPGGYFLVAGAVSEARRARSRCRRLPGCCCFPGRGSAPPGTGLGEVGADGGAACGRFPRRHGSHGVHARQPPHA